MLRRVRAHVGSTSRIVDPNAECPVCGAPVFFYQNAFGSRVFFDELGPPWPKHPCTDNSTHDVGEARKSISPTSESLRSQNDFDFIQKWSGQDAEDAFAKMYGTLRWDVAVFVCCYQLEVKQVLVLGTQNGRRYLIVDDLQEISLEPGQLVTHYRNWISYVGRDDLRVIELKTRRVGSRRILDHILGIDTLSDAPQ